MTDDQTAPHSAAAAANDDAPPVKDSSLEPGRLLPVFDDIFWADPANLTGLVANADFAAIAVALETVPLGVTNQVALAALTARQALTSHLEAVQLAAFHHLARKYTAETKYLPEEAALALGMGITTAAARIEAGRILTEQLPRTYQALHDGHITWPKARTVIDAVKNAAPAVYSAVEAAVLPGAPSSNIPNLRDACQHAVIALDPHGAAERHRKARNRRDLWSRAAGDGMGTLTMHSAAEHVETVYQACKAIAATKTTNDDRTPGARRVDALTQVFQQILDTGTYAYRRDNTNPNTAGAPAAPNPDATTAGGTSAGGTGAAAASAAGGTSTGAAAGGTGTGTGTGTGHTATESATPGTSLTLEGPEPAAAPVPNTPTEPENQCSATGPDHQNRQTDNAAAPEPTHSPHPATRRDGENADNGAGGNADPDANREYDAANTKPDREPVTPGDTPKQPRRRRVPLEVRNLIDPLDRTAMISDTPPDGNPPSETRPHPGGENDCRTTESAPGRCCDRPDPLPTQQGQRPRINITIADSTLLGLDDQPAHLAGHGPITAVQARAIALGGDLYRMITDPKSGTLLDLGRTRYRPNQALIDFITARDRHCRWPGCRQPANTTELDHQTEYRPGQLTGGTTSAKNLRSLCTRHHHLRHTQGWTITTNPDHSTTITTPLGNTQTTEPPQPLPHHTHPLQPLNGNDKAQDIFAEIVLGSTAAHGSDGEVATNDRSIDVGPGRLVWRGTDLESYFAGMLSCTPMMPARPSLFSVERFGSIVIGNSGKAQVAGGPECVPGDPAPSERNRKRRGRGRGRGRAKSKSRLKPRTRVTAAWAWDTHAGGKAELFGTTPIATTRATTTVFGEGEPPF